MSDTCETNDGCCFFCEAAWAGVSQLLSLSARDVEILQRLMLEDDECEVARFLGLTSRTLRTHLERIRRKLGVRTLTELIVRLFDAHLDWFCEATPPARCRMIVRLARFDKSARMKSG
jgi:DNA-binding CsgD family transcriptional regulator